jgi:[ribosomal protein S5]-alanine N-acetyltransferase
LECSEGHSRTEVFALLPIDRDSRPLGELAPLGEELAGACRQTADLYLRVGYEPPWVGYVAADEGRGIGGGAFVGAPRDGVVEIAYFTLAEFTRRGHATRTATELVAIARRTAPGIILKAFTLPQENASTRILSRLGFAKIGVAHDADAGEVWEWRTAAPGG